MRRVDPWHSYIPLVFIRTADHIGFADLEKEESRTIVRAPLLKWFKNETLVQYRRNKDFHIVFLAGHKVIELTFYDFYL